MLSHSHRLKETILPISNALHNFTHRLDLSDAGAVLKRPTRIRLRTLSGMPSNFAASVH
jgi:hypothetical protein